MGIYVPIIAAWTFYDKGNMGKMSNEKAAPLSWAAIGLICSQFCFVPAIPTDGVGNPFCLALTPQELK